MSAFILSFLGLSLILYALLGGADYGAGVLEIFTRRTNRPRQVQLTQRAIGPVWEANHIWLILAVVILFTAYPKAFAEISTHFHVPITLLLIGMVLRGTAFTFRHYDVYHDPSTHVYSWVFRLSSLWVPFSLGLVLNGILSGDFPVTSKTYWDQYISPWLSLSGMAMGIFFISVFTYLASVYFIGESQLSTDQDRMIQNVRIFSSVSIFIGVFVFAFALWENQYWMTQFFSHPESIACFILATVLHIPIQIFIRKIPVLLQRLLGASQIGLVILGWFASQYPYILHSSKDPGSSLTFSNTLAPEATLLQLCIALTVGSLLILPSFFILLRVFKGQDSKL